MAAPRARCRRGTGPRRRTVTARRLRARNHGSEQSRDRNTGRKQGSETRVGSQGITGEIVIRARLEAPCAGASSVIGHTAQAPCISTWV
jgi:hypothetical protein